ncbi:hypothetical protein BH24ACT20_BH24ACT20_14940 [soil metagenome]
MRLLLCVSIASIGLFVAGCGGGEEEEAGETIPAAGETVAAPEVTTPAGGETVGAGQAETIQDIPFTLNQGQPVPPGFRAAYQRGALISVEFSKEGRDPFYPQGLEVDDVVGGALQDLQPEYPTIEFFSYDIDNPGTAETSEDLQAGEYGTLAAQLGVGYTPFVATLAPRGDEYIIENLFQGYVPQPVLNQSLFDLSSADVEGNTSDVAVDLGQIDLTESGGGIEYFSVRNRSERVVNLQGFSLRVLDPETGEVNPDSDGVLVNDDIQVQPGQEVSVGRVPDVVDAEGNQVAGTFEGGDQLGLAPGDQLALLDSGGAVASTITV